MDNPEYQRIQSALASVLADKLNLEVPAEDADLFDTGILDSQKFVELLLHIEQEFGTRIDIDDFEIENFRSTGKIAALILRHRNAAKHACEVDATAVERS